jgi:hypothetical protein
MARNLDLFVFFGVFLAPLFGAGVALLLTRGDATGTRLGRGLIIFGGAASGVVVVFFAAGARAIFFGT